MSWDKIIPKHQNFRTRDFWKEGKPILYCTKQIIWESLPLYHYICKNKWNCLYYPSESKKHSTMLVLKGLRTCPQYMWDRWKEKGWLEDSSTKLMCKKLSSIALSWNHWNVMEEKHNHINKKLLHLG